MKVLLDGEHLPNGRGGVYSFVEKSIVIYIRGRGPWSGIRGSVFVVLDMMESCGVPNLTRWSGIRSRISRGLSSLHATAEGGRGLRKENHRSV